MAGHSQLPGEKSDQRRVRFSVNRRCMEFDLNSVAILADDAIDLRIWNDVNAQNCHLLIISKQR